MVSTRMAEHIDANMGSMLIGVIVSAVLLGVSLVQTFYYYLNYPKDRWFLRTLVALTALFDTVHLVLITHTIYHYLVSNYKSVRIVTSSYQLANLQLNSKPESMELLIWSVLLEALFTGVTGALVQCFYLTRVWLLSNKNKFLTGFILAIVVANATMGTVWVVLSIEDATQHVRRVAVDFGEGLSGLNSSSTDKVAADYHFYQCTINGGRHSHCSKPLHHTPPSPNGVQEVRHHDQQISKFGTFGVDSDFLSNASYQTLFIVNTGV
ncbi:hypothetical protein H2248_003529 [Termitomyces sp. 'cryptogamus']|nr:hypothetical protein H2248_003529 [Termitomyces sp. 'cryptogamus']